MRTKDFYYDECHSRSLFYLLWILVALAIFSEFEYTFVNEITKEIVK